MPGDALLKDYHLPWMTDDGDDRDVILASRVRLARNFRGIPFPNRASFQQLAKVQELAGDVLQGLEAVTGQPFEHMAVDQLTTLERNVLVEKRLATKNFIRNPQYRSVFISRDERCSVMVNEEDHLRIQCAAPGLSLNAPFAMASRIDDLVESKLDIAFDERMGYLTSCPTNLGTGLRASVVLHLPGLAFTNNIDSIINISPQLGLAVRGLFGNGSEVIGNLYQISNQLTLGFTENELLENLKSAASEIVSRERQARKALEMYAKDRVEDAAWRAYGIMKYARYIASGEVLDLLGRVKLGADLGLLNELDSKFFPETIVASRTNYLQNLAGSDNMSKTELDRSRAAMVRKIFQEDVK